MSIKEFEKKLATYRQKLERQEELKTLEPAAYAKSFEEGEALTEERIKLERSIPLMSAALFEDAGSVIADLGKEKQRGGEADADKKRAELEALAKAFPAALEKFLKEYTDWLARCPWIEELFVGSGCSVAVARRDASGYLDLRLKRETYQIPTLETPEIDAEIARITRLRTEFTAAK